jgi:hypothetical protein
MSARVTQLSSALALLIAAVAALTLPGVATAHDRDRPLRPGVYEGTWHTDPVKIIVEAVSPNGQFSGQVHFEPSSRWPDYRFNFTGRVGRDESLTVTRVGDSCKQLAHTRAPRREGRDLVWRGDVTGEGLDRPYAFALRIPLQR